ncbi:unnamed protein product [Adineta ricciae]|uniref:Uncharacterized protein n=1 Tax=Adineta ricciae TaxID=249248 RepID=A0A815R487_ADIRI|nr:unnamed protein product [Adineta ricciae]
MNTNPKNNEITRSDHCRMPLTSFSYKHNAVVHHSQSQPSTFKIPGQIHRSLSQDQNSRSRTKDKRPKVIIHTTIQSVTKSINSTNNNLLSVIVSHSR